MHIEKRLRKVFSETFNVFEDEIKLTTKQANLDEWDSLGQLRLFMNLESEFKISFHIDEIKELNSFEMLLKSIQEKR